ncbi:dethiobiotin synthase [Psychrobium sp. MM17-31]|uniref:dethiobiotin synthase n=1 Tax=Psychrobium sp. MM17-31 TaxID=2917758 RepID=UPI001EF4B949|nr:dethiobiotin synthase [Psychrobium sp. MM17-31]MCG7531913.1 dethiobiotin synthase [Psychrobium sp. MM17-31]
MNQQRVYFVTGTDTDVGKTFVSALLLQHLAKQGSAIGYKPIAAGAELIDGELKNDDALTLIDASSEQFDYQRINPICFAPPIAPHIAAVKEGAALNIDTLNNWWQHERGHSDIALIEGAGGWRLPLNDKELLSQFVQAQQCEVIVVIGMKLGCLNHALLTIEAIKADGLTIKGWVANQLIDRMPYYDDNLAYLQQAIDAPLLGEVVAHQQYHDGLFKYI